MNPKFKELIDALKTKNLEKVTSIVSSITSISPEESYYFVVPGRPLFVDGEVVDMEDYIIKSVQVNFYYPGWVLEITIYDKEQSVSYSYAKERAPIEGVYVHE